MHSAVSVPPDAGHCRCRRGAFRSYFDRSSRSPHCRFSACRCCLHTTRSSPGPHIARSRRRARRVLPFRLRRHPPARPFAETLRFTPGHRHHWHGFVAARFVEVPSAQCVGHRQRGLARRLAVTLPCAHRHWRLRQPEALRDIHFVRRFLFATAHVVIWRAAHGELSGRYPHIPLPIPRIHLYLTGARTAIDCFRRRRRSGPRQSRWHRRRIDRTPRHQKISARFSRLIWHLQLSRLYSVPAHSIGHVVRQIAERYQTIASRCFSPQSPNHEVGEHALLQLVALITDLSRSRRVERPQALRRAQRCKRPRSRRPRAPQGCFGKRQ
jgi:hypothetical protein